MPKSILSASALLAIMLSHTLQAEELTIAFWNVENLFDEHRDQGTPREDLFIPSDLREKLRKDGEIIRELNADILGLMEVEGRSILKRLIDEELTDMGYRYHALQDANDERGIDTAIVSRRPFLCQSFPVPGFYRELLVARFSDGGMPYYVIVNHWKSRFEGGNDLRMNCSNEVVRIVREWIPEMEGGPTVPVIIGGDFNDNDTDPSVLNLEEHGLINTLKRIPAKDRWTLPYFNREENQVELDSFDHIFINAECQKSDHFRWVSSDVVRPQRMLTTRNINGQEYLWPDDDNQNHIGYSDHFPVVAKFRIINEDNPSN